MISAVVLTKDEEKNIEKCLKSLSWCDEIVVVDDNSEDKTQEIARKIGAKVYVQPLEDFSIQRNFGTSKASGDWILFVDADERVTDALIFEVLNVISNWTNGVGSDYKGFYIRRFDFIWGKELKYGESGLKLLRLAKKNAGEWEGKVHEKLVIRGKVGTLKNYLVHYPHQTVVDFLRDINFYTDVRAKELYLKKIRIYGWDMLVYPLSKFVVNFFVKRGFLDGVHGLIFAIFMSFHSFLVRGKLWLKQEEDSNSK